MFLISAAERARVDGPVEVHLFERLMAGFGAFEASPHIAVGVSGGADSMALSVLARDWVRARGGQVTALTVDHGLRAESAAEASQVGAWLSDLGIAQQTLVWRGEKPASGIQAAARDVRLGLLGDWCSAAGVLHLLLAHHRDDQAETVLQRLAKASGLAGLAGMPAVQETPALRVLRPFLGIGKDRLVATCRNRGVPWLEDPSNQDPRFARGRLRAVTHLLAAEGLTAANLASTAQRLGTARSALELAGADALARWAAIFPEGYARLHRAALLEPPDEIARRCLGQTLASIGGGVFPPRGERFDRLLSALRVSGRREVPERAWTLGGCRILPEPDHWLVVREPAAARERLLLAKDGSWQTWDRRFRVRIGDGDGDGDGDGGVGVGRTLVLARLGAARPPISSELQACSRGYAPIPKPVLPALPAIWCGDQVLAVPHLGFTTPGIPPCVVRFSPRIALAGAPFGTNATVA